MRWHLLFALVLTLVAGDVHAGVRIKDIANLKGVRENQLVGYGIVMGLKGTGDTLRNSPFTEQSLQSLLDRMGINVRGTTLRTRNVAAVVVTADLPPFASRGSRIDVTISSMGDSSSLMGGTLVVTALRGADGEVYAAAQGPIAVAGFAVEGAAQSITQGVPTAGRIPNGALIERELPDRFNEMESLILELRNPDFVTATRIIDAVNAYGHGRFHSQVAFERDYRTIFLSRPRPIGPVRFIAEIGEILVEPDTPAKVVIDERTGTVVIGRAVQVSTVAVTQGNLTVRITEAPVVSQPNPFAPRGETVVVPRTNIDVNQPGMPVAILRGTDLQRLVRGLNQIGLKPSGIIAILQAIKSAGALQADLVIQ
jgi:flagellar P-ring protein precursor FlgI